MFLGVRKFKLDLQLFADEEQPKEEQKPNEQKPNEEDTDKVALAKALKEATILNKTERTGKAR